MASVTCPKCGVRTEALESCAECGEPLDVERSGSSTRGRMNRCAVCDRTYESEYDACPHCAREVPPAAEPTRSKLHVLAACLGIVLAIALLGTGIAMCSSGSSCSPFSPKDDSALAQKVRQATDGSGLQSVAITANSDGKVVVDLKITKEELGNNTQARDAAQDLAGTIFSQAPEATTVYVFDGTGVLMGMFTRE